MPVLLTKLDQNSMNRSIFFYLLAIAFVSQFAVAEIVFVAELFRHGARAASSNRIPFNQTFKVPPSSLTANGEYMQYLLGSYMRKTYIENGHVLSSSYKEQEIQVLSSRTSRTIQSAYSHLAGLYPPGTGSNVSNPNITDMLPFGFSDSSITKETPSLPFNSQSIPVYTSAEEDDFILHGYVGEVCPNANAYQDASQNTTAYLKVQDQLSNTIENLAAVLNLPASKVNMLYVKKIYSELQCARYEGFDLPIQPGSELWNNMSFVYNFVNVYRLTYIPKALKAYVTHFLKDLRDAILNVENGVSNLRLKVYSAHDYTLITILNYFNLISWECKLNQFSGEAQTGCVAGPEFASQIVWELHNIEGEYYVVMKYNNEVQNICNSSDGMCALEDFIKLLEAGILNETEYRQVCGVRGKSKSGKILLGDLITYIENYFLVLTDGRKKKKYLRAVEYY